MKKPISSISGAWFACLVAGCGSTEPESTSNNGPIGSSTDPGAVTVSPTVAPGATGPVQPSSTAQPPVGPTAGVAPVVPTTGGTGPVGSTGPVAPTPTGTAPTNPPDPVPTPTTTGSEPTSEPVGTNEPTDPPPGPVILPELVTSAQGSYWQEGQLTEANGAATLTVNEGTELQEWLGFGGTFNEAGWHALAEVDASERARAIELLFDAQNGAHFVFGRIPMGASDYAVERYTLNDTPNDTEMTNFSIERDRMYLIPYIKAALAINPNLRLWGSPWTPPAWMKTNNDLNGIKEGETAQAKFKNEPGALSALALYFALFVEKYAEEEGIDVEAVQPQNEPGYATRYPSCLWDPPVLRDFIRDHLGPTFTSRNVDAEIWLGTMSHPDDVNHVTTVMSDNAARAYVKGIGLQWNTKDSTGPFASQYQVPVVQTEHRCGNYPFDVPGAPPFNPDQPPNDHAYAVESWGYIQDWIEAGVNAYSAWNMVLDTKGHNSDYERPWPQNALLTVDRTTKTLNVTPVYYTFRHVSQFVDAGAKRVDVDGAQAAEALAFKNPDGGIVTIVHNPGGQAQQVTLAAGGRTVQFSVPAQGWATANIERP